MLSDSCERDKVFQVKNVVVIIIFFQCYRINESTQGQIYGIFAYAIPA